MNDKFMELREAKRNSFAFLKNVYTRTYIVRYTKCVRILYGNCHHCSKDVMILCMILFAGEFARLLMFLILRLRVRPTNRGSANPINQNILKLGPLLGLGTAYPSFLRLHPFNKFSRRERKERFKEFSREKSRLQGRVARAEIPSPSSWPLRVS